MNAQDFRDSGQKRGSKPRARLRRSRESRLPDGWVGAWKGLWIAVRDVNMVFKDGTRGTVKAGDRVEVMGWSEITELGDDGPLPDTRKMTVYGRIDGREMTLAEPVDGSHGGNFGMSSGYHFLKADPLRPMHFPDDLPDDVKVPDAWANGEYHEIRMGIGGGNGFATIKHLGKRRLLSFFVDENDWYSTQVVLDTPSLDADDYFKSENPIVLADFLAAAEYAWVQLFGGKKHVIPSWGRGDRRVPVSAIPTAWIERMHYLETLGRDPEAYRRHREAEESAMMSMARSLIPTVTFEQAIPVLANGGVIECLKFEERFNSLKDVPVHVVRTNRRKVVHWIIASEGIDDTIVGMLDPVQAAGITKEARDHMNGLLDEASLRIRWPNRERQWVLPDDPEAEKAPRLTARNLIVWDDPVEEKGYYRNGRAVLGGRWTISAHASDRGPYCSVSREGETNDSLKDDDCHRAEMFFTAESHSELSDMICKATEWAYSEEVLHLMGGGWSHQRVPPESFSTDVLEMAARRELAEMGYKGDPSRRRHMPSSKRLTAIAWELRRRGSSLGWKIVGESLAHDLGMAEDE